ncbi:hypothetical protein BGZ96_006799 [Linnemannia gamsii]|uniref:Uncharacterized protein n=1 Tax=Linnemannia gamsii TaxID=64522 RepID=A0ABQ7K2V8_9FUNG|nr:hypothetical protein BGZ96_006799 [Linnemannia gamsii]
MASKSLRLFFYQEYVRRVGVKFVFESFDLETDRVVFRPLVADNQYRFRTGMTLQSPQLEEVAVKTMPGLEVDMCRVQCDRGRYFTIKPAAQPTAATAATAATVPVSVSQEDGVEPEEDEDMEADVDLGADGPEATTIVMDLEATTGTTAAPSTIQTTSSTRKRTAAEKGYLGTKNFLDKSCPVPVRKTGVRKMDGTRYSFLNTYPWSLEYQVESEIMGPLEGEYRTGSGRRGKGKTVEYESRDHFGNTGSSSSPVERGDQLTSQHHRHQDDVGYASFPYERMDSIGSSSSGGSRHGGQNISSRDNATKTAPSYRRANSPEMADKIADKSADVSSARTYRQGSSSNNTNSGSGPRFLRTLRFECSINFLDPKRATRSVLGRWLEGKMYQWSKVLGGGKKTSNQSHTIQWQSALNKQQSPSQPQLRQQQKQQEKQKGKQKGKQKDNTQNSSSLSLLYRRLQQQEQQKRRSGSTESGESSTAAPTTAAPAIATRRKRGRVIRAIDILLGPTDSDGSSIDHERVRQHSENSPFHTQPPSQSGSNVSLSASLPPHQADASIAGGRCMIPAIDLNKMGSSSASPTF